MTKEAILRITKEEDVRFIRLQFTDILGVMKNVAITVDQLEKAIDGELMFDGSSIEGFVRIEESDMYLKPDLNTFVILPSFDRNGRGKTARFICDIYDSNNEPFTGSPRYVLTKVLKEAEEMGYKMYVGPEPEFFMFLVDEDGQPTLETNDKASYFDLAPVDKGEDARREMVEVLQNIGFEIEASHHELAPGQHEIDFKYQDALTTADNIVTFRIVVRMVAQKHGLHATFMPKPIYGIAGSGMHVHVSLFKDNENIFYDANAEDGLSDVCRHFIAGVIKHTKAISAITSPTVNSYKRLVPGYEAPVHIAWSYKNRSPLIRIPARRGIGTRIELRNPDPSCNPYLALAVILKAGLHGIKNKLIPPAPVEQNIYEMDLASRKMQGIESLPENLYEAITELSNDKVIQEALGPHVYSRFSLAKIKEWENYSSKVYDWEINEYLEKF
ncbi:Glutamine synthetase type I [Candidatus Syntrophocurvum alkaliphilum]|uniref:Glutamine synthetase n=1 Tax=Candidatus Syntrophocurvum alkaliphilum TaxID=2293317 RepID=A0A6I6DAP3_9FIRM|nr:type I glutamate--ammonia ligase [Candidatus Syntrophocurvum alkaliphilum]QGT99419.1 Glutamine synthetase type I [Candidatus Syntrophocurvum alkaliphilum]